MMWWWLVACAPHAEPVVTPEVDLAARVVWAAAQPAERVPVATLPAQVVPSPGGVERMGPGAEARILGWRVEPGDAVAAGDVLAVVAGADLAARGAARAEAQARLEAARTARELAEQALAGGVGSRGELAAAQGAEAAAAAALAGAVRAARALGDFAPGPDGTFLWRAPAGGVVEAIRCSLGAVEPGAWCVEVARTGDVLQVDVPERLLGAIDAPVEVQLTTSYGREWTFHEVSRATAVEPSRRTLRLRLATDAVEPPLRGTTGAALVSVPAALDVARVPADAVVRMGTQPVVFVRGESGGDPVEVELLGSDATWAYLRGVTPGDEVAVRGVFLLKSLALMGDA